jgi:plasmid stabilization system protein ParE
MSYRQIKWDKQAVNAFHKAIEYIRKESPQNADKVKQEILTKINKISERPERHPPDKYKSANNGSYRAFELHHYRISYLIKQNEIIIARIRHTKRKPRRY